MAAGTSFVAETLDAFNIPTSKHTLVVDMFGYCGSPALATLQDRFLKCQEVSRGFSFHFTLSSLYAACLLFCT